jgi:Protein of unknown function (DUF2934)
MSNSTVQVIPRVEDSQRQKSSKKDPTSTFSQDEIRARAYQIYEFRNRNGNHADEDWSQAETELIELLHAK